MNWIVNNMEWIFSGAGIAVLAAVAGYFTVKSYSGRQKQFGGSRSKQNQSLKDVDSVDQVQLAGDDSVQIQKGDGR